MNRTVARAQQSALEQKAHQLVPANTFTSLLPQKTGAQAKEEIFIEASYVVYFGGLQFVTMETQIRLSPENYAMAFQGRTEGVMEYLFGARIKSQVTGLLQATDRENTVGITPYKIIPTKYAQKFTAKTRARAMRFSRSQKEGYEIVAVPKSPILKNEDIPKRLEEDLSDIMSSVLVGMLNSKKDACPTVTRTFDGWRIIGLKFTKKKQYVMETPYFTYPAVQCTARSARLKGEKFPSERKSSRRRTRKSGGFSGYVDFIELTPPYANTTSTQLPRQLLLPALLSVQGPIGVVRTYLKDLHINGVAWQGLPKKQAVNPAVAP